MPLSHMRWRWAKGLVLLALGLAGCRPALDWREVRPPGSSVSMLFPCRPEAQQRTVSLGERRLSMRLERCEAAGLGFSLAVLEVPSGSAPAPLLDELRRQMVGNLDGVAKPLAPLPIAGVASAPLAWRIDGHLPDGRPMQADAITFAEAAHLHQAVVIGGLQVDARQRATAVETFFTSLRVR